MSLDGKKLRSSMGIVFVIESCIVGGGGWGCDIVRVRYDEVFKRRGEELN